MSTPVLRRALLALLLAALPAAASDPVAALTQLVGESAASPDPTMAFLRGAAALPDFALDRAQVLRALEAAGAPSDGPIGQLLGPTLSLSKKGDRIAIQRSHPTTLTGPTSAIEVGKDVKVRLRVRGEEAALDKIDGIRVGESANELYDLWDVKFTRVNGRPVARVTAGLAIFSKTVTVDLPEPAARAGSTPPAPDQSGITQALGQGR